MDTLLALFYNRIKGSQENIASEGLSHILNNSLSARNGINKLLQQECNINIGVTRYDTQTTGENLERPDISGYDGNNIERLIIEAKFWASLTENQPIEYIKRLKRDSILLFICPEQRKRLIQNEITYRLKNSGISYTLDSDNYKLENNNYLIIKSWSYVLNIIKRNLIQNNEQNLISDIDQIIGFCDYLDENSFIPFDDHDVSPEFGKRICSFYDLADKIHDELKKYIETDDKNLKSTPQKYGYTKYFRVGNYGFGLYVRFDLMKNKCQTPFWLYIRDINETKWGLSKETETKIKLLSNKLNFPTINDGEGKYFVSLHPLLQKEEDIVVKGICKKIVSIINELCGGNSNVV